MVSIAALAVTWLDFRWSLVLLLFTFTLSRLAKIPFDWYKLGIYFALGGLVFSFFVTTIWQVNPALFKVLPHEYVMTELLQITPPGSIVGYSAVTIGGLWYQANNTISFFAVVISSITLVYILSPSDIVQMMAIIKIPSQLIFSFMAGYRFFPITTRALSDIINAQKLRGWEVKTRNPFKFVHEMSPFVYPVGRLFLKSVDIVAISTATRAFGASPITPYKSFRMKAHELLLTIIAPAIYLTALYLTLVPPYWGAI
jgi:energy-coupling factor transporter transmembrane protein EcfT